MLTTHRLAYLCCQCDASLEMKLALGSVVAGMSGEGILRLTSVLSFTNGGILSG